MTKRRRICLAFVGAVCLAALLNACGEQQTAEHAHGTEEAAFERGPHNGRLLESGSFAIELLIFEAGVSPVFRVYAYDAAKPVAPRAVAVAVTLKRLGGKTERFAFKPEGDYLAADAPVEEPHSFDVVVAATHGGKTHRWAYESYEGRTTIADKAADEAGVTTEKTGPATIKQTVELLGHADIAPGAKASLRARFPGRVLSVERNAGDAVNTGDVLARIESNESLQAYAVTSPLSGIVLVRNVNPGDVTTDGVIFDVGDPAKLSADFHVFDRDAARISAGQDIRIVSLDGAASVEAKLTSLSPVKDPASQSIGARALFQDTERRFRPGVTVRGHVVVEETPVPLAVKTQAIQRFRDFEVVYAKYGETYEVRMLEIGRRGLEWTEVLGGIDAGVEYVVGNSFLIKADIEKSGASHDH